MTRHKFCYAAIIAAIVLCASQVLAQCPTGACPLRTTARVRTYERATFSATFNGGLTRVPTTTRFIPFCGAAQVVEPCAPVETVEPCAPIETVEPEPCAPVETVEPCAPVETCEPVATATTTIQTNNKVQICPNGACPIRSITKAAVNTAVAPARAVANLLDKANKTRVWYGLPALAYDETLTTGAEQQAQYCAKVGTLVQGAGCAEILASNWQGLETAINQWVQSPQHRALLLNGGYRFAGVAVVRDGHGRAWCAMRFR